MRGKVASGSSRGEGGRQVTQRLGKQSKDVGSSWKDFYPGVVCGGKMTSSVMKARSSGCTEEHLSALKASKEFVAWEKNVQKGIMGGDVSLMETSTQKVIHLFGMVAQHSRSFGTVWLKAMIVVLVLVMAFTVSYRYEQSQKLHPLVTDDVMSDVKRMMDERVPLPQQSWGGADRPVVEDTNDAGSEEAAEILAQYREEYEKMKAINEKLIRRVDDLELESQVERKRLEQSKAKEDEMFSALEASTHKVHYLSKELKESKDAIRGLESQVKISAEHSYAIKAMDMVLLAIESILVFSAMLAYFKSHSIRSGYVKARRSYAVAYKRQQAVLAAAEDVYTEALKHKSEVETADVQPKEASRDVILKPWDPIIDDLENVIKANVEGLDRQATPVQAMSALKSHFQHIKSQQIAHTSMAQSLQDAELKVNSLKDELSEMQQKIGENATLASEQQKALEEAHSKATVASSKVSILEEELLETTKQNQSLSEQIVRVREELAKVTEYASTLEESMVSSRMRRVKDHLEEFGDTMAVKVPNSENEDEDTQLNYASENMIDESALGERLNRIRQLIHEANNSPFELLSPNVVIDQEENFDAESALKNLPVFGPMHISSSDSDDDASHVHQDESLSRMLSVSEDLSSQVAEYIVILEGIYDGSDNATSSRVLNQLKKKKQIVDHLRQVLETQILTSQRELRAYKALKALRREVDFLSDQEEIEHGEKELKASDALFFARKKEKDACIELEKGQSDLRATLMEARDVVSQNA